MDIITINTYPADEDILNCIDYKICKYDCIYTDRCNALHYDAAKLKKENKSC